MASKSSKSKNATQPKVFPCTICDCVFLAKNLYDQHVQGKKHRKNESIAKEKQVLECKIYVAGLKDILNPNKFLNSYFSKFGKIRNLNISSRHSAVLTFEKEHSAQNAIKQHKHSHEGRSIGVKKFRSYQTNATALQTQDDKNRMEDAKVKEEDIQRQKVTDILLKAKNLPDQFESMSHLSLSEADFAMRRNICEELNSLFSFYFETCHVHQFGSSMNGYGMKGCDLDLYLDLTSTKDYDPSARYKMLVFPFPFKTYGVKNLTTKEAPLFLEDLEAMTDLDKVKFLRCVLRTKVHQFTEIMVIPSKRCPLVRFVHRKTGLKCDVSLSNMKAVYNSRLLKLYSQDPRVQQLVNAIRYWARVQNLTNPEGTTNLFTSYALTWLVLYYLMQRKPRVIPLVKDLLSLLKDEGVHEEKTDSVQCLVVPLTARLPPSSNKETVVELLHGFFQFYSSKIDWASQALSTWDGKAIPNNSLSQSPKHAGCKVGCINILDPFVLSHNITGNVNIIALKRFMSLVKKTVEITKNWSIARSPQPVKGSTEQKSWGLSDIFKPSPPQKEEKQSKEKRTGGRREKTGEEFFVIGESEYFVINLFPEPNLLTSKKFLQLCEKRGMESHALWCSLVRKMIVNVLDGVYMLNLVEEEVMEWSDEGNSSISQADSSVHLSVDDVDDDDDDDDDDEGEEKEELEEEEEDDDDDSEGEESGAHVVNCSVVATCGGVVYNENEPEKNAGLHKNETETNAILHENEPKMNSLIHENKLELNELQGIPWSCVDEIDNMMTVDDRSHHFKDGVMEVYKGNKQPDGVNDNQKFCVRYGNVDCPKEGISVDDELITDVVEKEVADVAQMEVDKNNDDANMEAVENKIEHARIQTTQSDNQNGAALFRCDVLPTACGDSYKESVDEELCDGNNKCDDEFEPLKHDTSKRSGQIIKEDTCSKRLKHSEWKTYGMERDDENEVEKAELESVSVVENENEHGRGNMSDSDDVVIEEKKGFSSLVFDSTNEDDKLEEYGKVTILGTNDTRKTISVISNSQQSKESEAKTSVGYFSNEESLEKLTNYKNCGSKVSKESETKKNCESLSTKKSFEKLLGNKSCVSKVSSFSYSCQQSLWVHRVKIKKELAGNKNLKGLELENEVSKKVLKILEDNPGIIKTDSTSREKIKHSPAISQYINPSKCLGTTTKDKNKEIARPSDAAENTKTSASGSFEMPITCKIVESYDKVHSTPRVSVLLQPSSTQVSQFRNLFMSLNSMITSLVSNHLMDDES